MSDVPRTLVAVAVSLRGYFYCYDREELLQDGVAAVLDATGSRYEREFRLSAGRIDFWLPLEEFGIEVKVDGSPLFVSRQLLRYARAGARGLILVTSRIRHRNIPHELAGVPVEVVCVTEGAL